MDRLREGGRGRWGTSKTGGWTSGQSRGQSQDSSKKHGEKAAIPRSRCPRHSRQQADDSDPWSCRNTSVRSHPRAGSTESFLVGYQCTCRLCLPRLAPSVHRYVVHSLDDDSQNNSYVLVILESKDDQSLTPGHMDSHGQVTSLLFTWSQVL